jgi:hypothetical protein
MDIISGTVSTYFSECLILILLMASKLSHSTLCGIRLILSAKTEGNDDPIYHHKLKKTKFSNVFLNCISPKIQVVAKSFADFFGGRIFRT